MNWGGLRVELLDRGARKTEINETAFMIEHSGPDAVHLPASQRWPLREQWRAGLEVPIVTVRYCWLALAAMVVPVVWGYKAVRSLRRRRHGLCPACGYDVRASGGTCPECGRAV